MITVKEIADEIVALQSRKNADYGNAFGLSMQEFGLTAPAIRLTDKLNRFKSLIKKEAEVKTESIEDTLIDLAAYAMMTVAEMRNGEVVSEKICKEIIENAGLKEDSDNRLKAGDEVELIGNDIIGANTGKIYAHKGDVGDIVCVEGGDVFVNFRKSHWQVQLKTEQVRKI